MSATYAPELLVGSQQPRILTRPEFTSEDAGEDAIDLASSVGLHLDPWQQLFVRVALAEKGDRWAAREVGKLVARQNGKGASDEAIVLHGLFLLQLPLQLWTAHQFKTTTEAFLRIRGWIDGSDDLRRLVKRITTANGDEGIELKSGARLRFIARSKSSGRGFSPQRIIFDEAQELATAAVTAMMPSMSAQYNPQALYAGTVPGEDNNAEHWTRIRDRGRSGESGRLAWLEWSPEGAEDDAVDLDAEQAWLDANPAVGYRPGLTLDSIAGEREAYDEDAFARERLSVWPTHTAATVIPIPAWRRQVDAESKIVGPPVFAVEVSEDRSKTVIAAAGRRDDGNMHVELVKYGRTGRWVLDELLRLSHAWLAPVIIDGISPAASYVMLLKEAGVEVVVPTANDMARACGLFYDSVTDEQLFHLGDPVVERSLLGASKRPLAGGWAWNRKSGDISPLVAVTLAAYGVLLQPEPRTVPQIHDWPDEAVLTAWEADE